MRLKIPLAVFFFLSCISLAGDLADEMRYKVDDTSYWASRNHNSLQIEAYMNRHTGVNIDFLDRLDRAFNTRFFMRYNLSANLTPQMVHPLNLHPDWVQFGEDLNIRLQALPAVEHMVYQGRMNPSLASNLHVGDGLVERGFMHGSASLHNVYQSVPNARQVEDVHHFNLFKIESRTGRYSSNLRRSRLSLTIWPKNSFFQVLAKEYDPQSKITFFHLKEINEAQASDLPRLRSFHNAVPVNLEGRKIILSCL